MTSLRTVPALLQEIVIHWANLAFLSGQGVLHTKGSIVAAEFIISREI